MEEIEFCNRLFRSHGQPLRYMTIHGNYEQCLYYIKKFSDECFSFREYTDFMFDGIVVSYLDEEIRKKLGRKNYINKYSMAVKFNPLSKITRFLGYTFEVGQNGEICPMYHYQPVEFLGTIHNKSSASSYARFVESNLKVNDLIKVTYRNDVMPYVTTIDCEENRNNPNPLVEFPSICPECHTKLVLSSTGKSIICPNNDCPGRVLGRMSNMLQKLGIKGFAKATIKELGVTHLNELFDLKEENIANIIGPTNAQNLIVSLNTIRSGNIADYILVGSLGFSGIASQKWKIIFEHCTMEDLINNKGNLSYLGIVQGIGPSTLSIIYNEFPYYEQDLIYLNQIPHKNTKDSISSDTIQIRFTGCRNLQLQEQLVNLGYDCDGNGSVTKRTDILIIPYLGFESGKTKKVRPDCIIVPIDEFKTNYQSYLDQVCIGGK